MMSQATLAGMLDHELRRAIDRMSDSKRQIEEDIAALKEEIERRRQRRKVKACRVQSVSMTNKIGLR